MDEKTAKSKALGKPSLKFIKKDLAEMFSLELYSDYLAPYKLAILPLAKKYHGEKALEIYNELSKYFMCSYDETGSIGKRYRRSDAIGTPWCLTVDNDTLENGTVTLRDRDTMEQVTLKLDEVKDYIEERINF